MKLKIFDEIEIKVYPKFKQRNLIVLTANESSKILVKYSLKVELPCLYFCLD